MAKTQETLEIEKALWKALKKRRLFCCPEVTIGWYGSERVDFLVYDCYGNWRCYEIKVSKADFYSNSKNTFLGHLNYYVMPPELYEQVKNDVPAHIGVQFPVRIGLYMQVLKKAKRQALKVDEQTLKNSMIRSLSREVDKFMT